MKTLEYIKSRLQRSLKESDEVILKKLVLLSFSDLRMLFKLHSNLYNTTEIDDHKDWAEKTQDYQNLIGLAFDYKYYELFGTTFSDMSSGYNYVPEWIKIQNEEGLCFLDGEFSHLENGDLYNLD